jgi:hypothetical protein
VTLISRWVTLRGSVGDAYISLGDVQAADAAAERLVASRARIEHLESALVAAREERGLDAWVEPPGAMAAAVAAAEARAAATAAVEAAAVEVAELMEKLMARDEELMEQAEVLGAAEAEMDELLTLLSGAEQRLCKVEGIVKKKVAQMEMLRAARDSEMEGPPGGEAEAAAEAEEALTAALAAAREAADEATAAREAAEAEAEAAARSARAQLREAHERLALQEALMRSRTEALVSTQAQVRFGSSFRSAADSAPPGWRREHQAADPSIPSLRGDTVSAEVSRGGCSSLPLATGGAAAWQCGRHARAQWGARVVAARARVQAPRAAGGRPLPQGESRTPRLTLRVRGVGVCQMRVNKNRGLHRVCG